LIGQYWSKSTKLILESIMTESCVNFLTSISNMATSCRTLYKHVPQGTGYNRQLII